MFDATRIQDWLAAYRHAWTTDDRQEVARLFSDGARYFTAPYHEPLTGTDQVVDFWAGEGFADPLVVRVSGPRPRGRPVRGSRRHRLPGGHGRRQRR